MPRLARLDMPGLLQHVIVRGIERCDIFCDDQDRLRFLERLSALLLKTDTRCFAWSLMSNHFHLLLMPTAYPLSHLMRRLLTGYAVVFNRKYNRSGHLFQNRYKSIVCDEESYLLQLVRYIHLNPLRAGLVPDLAQLADYPWCGHSVLMGNCRMEGQETKEILGRFGKHLSRARQNYLQFVADGIPVGKRNDLVGGGLRRSQGDNAGEREYENFDERVLGSGSFVDSLRQEELLRDRIVTTIALPELVKNACRVLQLEPEAVRRPSKARVVAEARGIICFISIRELGYKGNEVGRELHLGPAGVSIAARRGERLLIDNSELKERILSFKLSNFRLGLCTTFLAL